jgi:hypothetical protein
LALTAFAVWQMAKMTQEFKGNCYAACKSDDQSAATDAASDVTRKIVESSNHTDGQAMRTAFGDRPRKDPTLIRYYG